MIILSSIVAAIGVLNNSVAVIIGAGYSSYTNTRCSLSLATALGDLPMARSALKTIIVGISVAIVLSAALGFLHPVDPFL